MHVDFPYQIDQRGRSAAADDNAYYRELIELVLLTAPGERVNRPTFGCGLLQLVFAPNSAELAATMQYLAQSALQQWLGELITVDAVSIEAADSTLRVEVRYLVRRTQEMQTATINRPL